MCCLGLEGTVHNLKFSWGGSMCPLTYLFTAEFQSVAPLPLHFQCQAVIAVFFNVNSCKLPPADLPGNVPPLPVLRLAGLHATSFNAAASPILTSCLHYCCQHCCWHWASLLVFLIDREIDSLLAPTSRERQKSKKCPKLTKLSSDPMQSWITILPILRKSQVYPHSYYWISYHSAFLSSWGKIGDGMSTGNGDSEELSYNYLNLMKPNVLEVKVARGNSLTVSKEIGGKKEWKQVPGYLEQVALLSRAIALQKGGNCS